MGCTELYRRGSLVGFKTISVTLDESHEPQESTNYNRAMGVGLMKEVFNRIKILRHRRICVPKCPS